ncbi:HK97 gp10 family phage protein [Galbibacter sp. BG1]|uniref:HK97 gp10 family phage protein n=1 Tax=Galbibacter sp. BG1 TaxID=1170699 RepID=UPI0015BC3EA2|nr:HK97 gp10 family phage protein [Galbibacter sp. BG1]QLE02885.1 HK97 gp10 family phage protein [Galbibacter sp. BG1]
MSRSIFEIKGFKELEQKIKKLPDKAKKREMVKILRKSAQTTVKAARQEAPQSSRPHYLRGGKKIQPGNLKKSIGVQVARKAKNPMIVVRPKSSGKYDGFYGRAFVIFGHNVYRAGFKRSRKGNRSRNSLGAKAVIKANPFMNRAYQRTEGKVSQESLKSTEKYIQKLIDRL